MQQTACYEVTAINPNEIWKSSNVFSGPLPLLALQLCFVMLCSRISYCILKPLHQPRFISDIFAGNMIGPQYLLATIFWRLFYPASGILNVETITHVGLLYYVFLSGLEMNLDVILQASKKGTSIAVAGIIIPMLMGAGIFFLHQSTYRLPLARMFFDDNSPKAYLFWTMSLSTTGFPVVARILADLKLFYTGLGRAALNAAMISDFYNWVLFVILIPFATNNQNQKAVFSALSTILFIVFCLFVVHPPLKRFINRKTNDDSWDNYQLVFVLVGALAFGYVTDFLGTHSIVGAFVFGLIIPPGKFSDMLIEKSDDFVSWALAPQFFIGAGLRINHAILSHLQSGLWTSLLILLLCIPKILSTVIATTFFGMSIRDGVGLGILMNTKGVLSTVWLILAWDRKILNRGSYSVIATSVFLMTAIVAPVINYMYKPKKRFERYKLRTVEKLRKDVELRILACVHNNRHASSMVNLIEAFNTTRVSPLHVFVLQLVELTGRATAILNAHMEKKHQNSSELESWQNLTKSQADLECITNTFKGFCDGNDATRVEILTALSVYDTIHEDIYTLAEDRCTSLVLLPFFKQPNVEGDLETTNVAHRDINLNVMKDAACSVGLFVDRGLGSLTNTTFRVLVLFIGGPDDREALAVAWRMAGNKRVQLSVVRILLYDEAATMSRSGRVEDQENLLSTLMDGEKQKQLDDEYICLFRHKAVHNEDSINYFEKVVHNGDEISSLLRELDEIGYDLYVVGKGKGRNSALLSNLLEFSDWPELGVIGDILASPTFGSSVLVLQQYGSQGRDFSTKVMKPNRILTHNNNEFETIAVRTE
ncbi:hypothetical protein L6164_002987 [Bauhinia variegata]|uniref:Uncharacterized protein n=1 Tax=Bauhinia variegata TaxID=167791 RepID=A0ACB9PZB3_BAUVA|nr:hypothetical protein L6164_002987 [Bauhinia variegata]